MNPLQTFDSYALKVIKSIIKSPARQETIHQFVKFALIGVMNTFIDFSIYFVLTRYTGFFSVHMLIANIISFGCGTTCSFFANRTWTFGRSDKATVGEAARFYATTLSGLALSQGLLFVLIKWIGVYDLLAKVFTTIVTTLWNFTFKKFFVFTPPANTV